MARIFYPAIAMLLLCARGAFAQISETGGFAAFEAESFNSVVAHGSSANWSAGNSVAGYSGSGYVEALPNAGLTVDAGWTTTSPELQYTVSFATTGTYYVWVRGYGDVSTDASLHAGIDGTSDTAARMAVNQFNTWQWTNTVLNSAAPAVINVTSTGNHTFSIWMRDDGIRIDKIILTTNPNYTPQATTNFWQNQNIYQVVTDRFFNGDSSNDNADGNFNATAGASPHGGDLKGLEQKLDYIKSLGATAIWISPIVLNGSGQYHGYAGRDFYKVDPRWGTLADLQHMVQEAHRRGLLVINDIVVNHGATLIDSGDSGWPNFKAPPNGYNLRFTNSSKQYPAPFDINATNPTIASLFHNNGAIQNYGDNTQVTMGELSGLDDFKTESSYVRNAMADIYKYWVSQVQFDGFRIDTVKHVENAFWQTWCPLLHQHGINTNNPNFFMFGEVYDGSDSKCGSYTGTKSGGAFELDSVLDYPLYFLINSVFANASGNTQQIENRYNQIAGNYDAAAQMSLVTFLDNHDQPRFMNTSGANANRLNVALTFLYTSRGIPCLYYGTEQAFDGGADPNNRQDMFDGQFEQGTSLGDNFNETSAQFQLVAKLNNFRRLYPALRTGSHVNQWNDPDGPGLFAYSRRLGTQEALVVLNTATTTETLTTRNSIYPAGTVVANLLNPAETLTINASQQFPSISMPSTSAKIFVAQSIIQALDPVVTASTPGHDAVGVGTASTIKLTFSKSMDTSATQPAFSTNPATTGTFAWSTTALPNDTLTFTPAGAGLTANTLYTVTLGAAATDSGGKPFFAPFQFRFTTGSNSAQTARPSATTNAATSVAMTSATLNGNVNPNSGNTTVTFQYGRTSSYGTTTTVQNIGSGSTGVNVSANISGLTAGRTYHFRVTGTNSAGTTNGSDQTFVTPTTAQAPTATTNAATNMTINSATLNGTVNPAGQSTSVQFFYGVAPNQLTESTTAQNIGSGTGNISVNSAITGLAPATTYYFMVSAVSGTAPNTTTTTGSTLTFTTAPVTPSVTTTAATSVATTTATLNGTVNPNGSATTGQFEYGLTTSYGNTTAAQTVGAGTTPAALSAAVVDLLPGTIYHYRALAENPNGDGAGADQTFKTLVPPPTVTTSSATSVALNSGTLNGLVNPNGAPSTAWFEYGLTTSYGSTTRRSAGDNAEAYSGFNYTTSSNGGSGLGAATFLEGTGGGLYLSNSSSGNRQIDGSNSFGVYAGSGGQALARSLTNPTQVGTLTLSARFDLSNAAAFSGFNIKSAQGNSFAANELLSFGLSPSAGNNAIFVSGSVNQAIPLGSEIRGAVIDFKLDYDCALGTYTLGAKFRASSAYTTISGNLKATGQTATHLGFANFNNNGSNQNLIFDTLTWAGSDSIGAGNNPTPINLILNTLSAHTLYHYRAVGLNASGITLGADMTFITQTAFEQWRQTKFGTIDPNDSIAGITADADRDGANNTHEYVFGMNPNASDLWLEPSIGRTSANGSDYLTITFRKLRPANGVVYIVEESTDLVNWSAVDGSANVIAGPVDQLDGTDLLTVRGNIPLTNQHAFLRLHVTVPDGL